MLPQAGLNALVVPVAPRIDEHSIFGCPLSKAVDCSASSRRKQWASCASSAACAGFVVAMAQGTAHASRARRHSLTASTTRRWRVRRNKRSGGGAAHTARTADEPSNTQAAVEEPQPLWQQVAAFVVPTYALVVTNLILTALDKGFIGRVSSLQLAALGPATTIFDSSSYLLTFLNTATLTLLGSAQESQRNALRSHAAIFGALSGLGLGILLYATARPAVILFGANDAMLPHSVRYLQIRAVGSMVDRVGSISTQFWLAEKNGLTPLLATLIAAVVNAGGDYLLCEKYGVAGAAFATVAASVVSASFLIWRLRQRGLWPNPLEWPV